METKGEQNDKTTSYDLFLLPVTEDNISLAQVSTYARIAKKYILLFDNFNKRVDKNDEKVLKDKQGIRITNEHIGLLSDSERQWLIDCMLDVVSRESAKQEERLTEIFSDKLEKLEKLLKAEQSKLSEQAGNNGG